MKTVSADTKKKKQTIIKACSKIDKELKELQELSVREHETKDKLEYPIKLHVNSKVFLAKFLKDKLETKDREAQKVVKDLNDKERKEDAKADFESKTKKEESRNKINLLSWIHFDMQDLASALIKVDEQYNIVTGKKKRVEHLYDFYQKKSSSLSD